MAEGKNLPIVVRITAIDGITDKMKAINSKIAKITGPVARVQKAFSNLGEESGIAKLGEDLGKVGSAGKDFMGDLSAALAKVAAVGIAAAASVFAVTKGFAEAGNDVEKYSNALGLSTKAYQELAYAAKQADIPADEFNSLMGKFSKGIGEAAVGAGEAFVGFNALGISVYGAHHKVKSLEELLPEVADGLSNIGNASVRNALMLKIFGKAGFEMNEFVKDGSAGIAKFRAEAERVGAVMSPEDLKTATEFDSAFKSITSTLMFLRNTIGAALAPELIKLGRTLQTYVLDHKKDIQEFASKFAGDLPGNIQRVVEILSGFAEVLRPIGAFMGELVDKFGAVNVAAGAAVAYIAASVLPSLFALIGALTGLNLSLAGVIVRIGLLAFGPAIAAIGNFITAIRAGYGVMAAFNLVLAANPIGLVVTAIGALVGLGVLLYNKWQPFHDLLDSIWTKLKGVFGFGGSSITTSSGSAASSGAALGPPLGLSQSVAAAATPATKNDSHVLVEFTGQPQGTRTEIIKGGSGVDLHLGPTGGF